ncbi:MAG: thiamine phosphate synthase [Geminicoccaceae bacterium]
MRPPRLDLYLVTDRVQCARLGVERVVAEAVAGGATIVQIRDDDTPTADLVALTRRVKKLLAGTGVPLIINNRLDVALAAEADGLHVGQDDLPAVAARAALGPEPLLGLSITDPAQLAAVPREGVDYLGVGPIFATATKTDAAPAMGLDGLATCRNRSALPIVAIGGIKESDTEAVIRSGADGIAVVSAICSADDPRAAASRLAAIVREAKAARRGAPGT